MRERKVGRKRDNDKKEEKGMKRFLAVMLAMAMMGTTAYGA